MDYGSYRAPSSRMHSGRPAATAAPTVPVTMSTGIPLNERFRHMQEQQQVMKSFAHDGYGLPGQAKFGGMNPVVAQRVKMAQRERAMALALARQQPMTRGRGRGMGMRGGGGRGPVIRNQPRPAVSVKARLGIPRRSQPALVLRKRGVLNDSGRGTVLNRVQKTAGAITRRRGLPANAKPLRAKFGNNTLKSSPPRGNAARRGRGGAPGRGGPSGRGGAPARVASGGGGGRGGGRGRGRGGAGAGASNPTKVSKEDLDTELEAYMAKSKSYLDRQLDDYMNQKKAEAAAVTAGTVVVGDADVTMSET